MPDVWDPPIDASGGFVILKYSNGAQSHKQRLHIASFDPATQLYTAPRGAEHAVVDTLANYFAVWKLFYTAAWTIVVDSLWRVVGGVHSPVFPPPAIAGVAGTHAGPEANSFATELVATIPTTFGGKFKLFLIAPAATGAGSKVIWTSASAAPAGNLMAYLSGADTELEGHDGHQPTNYASVTAAENRRLRRHYDLV